MNAHAYSTVADLGGGEVGGGYLRLLHQAYVVNNNGSKVWASMLGWGCKASVGSGSYFKRVSPESCCNRGVEQFVLRLTFAVCAFLLCFLLIPSSFMATATSFDAAGRRAYLDSLPSVRSGRVHVASRHLSSMMVAILQLKAAQAGFFVRASRCISSSVGPEPLQTDIPVPAADKVLSHALLSATVLAVVKTYSLRRKFVY